MRQLLLTACLLSACKGNPLVVVTVDASPPLTNVATLHTVATLGTRSKTYDIGMAVFTLPPAKTFGFDVGGASSGRFTVDVEARDAAGKALASGSGSVDLAAGTRRDIAITLMGGGGGGDGGMDLATMDGASDGATDGGGGDGCVPATCQSLGMVCGTVADNGCGQPLDCSPCQLNAIYPPLGITGSDIVLEGKFNGTTTVSFPGGSSAAATVLGANRASITVPGSVTGGLLTVSSGGSSSSLPFRRPDFALGLASFGPNYEQAGHARQMPALGTARSGTSAVIGGKWLYVVGGFNGGALDSVERALVNADGTLGAFSAAGTLHTASSEHTSVILGGWLYVIGGVNGTALQRVERAAVAANGTLGTFSDAGMLTVPRGGATATIVGDFLYVIGGQNVSGSLTSVERAPIAADGTLGTFSDAGQTMRTARAQHASTVIGSRLYVFGGSPAASSYTDRVESAPISPDGTIGVFADAGVHFVAARAGHQLQVLGAAVYIFGGYDGAAKSSIESAAINPDDSLGAFATQAATSPGRYDFASVRVGNYVYEIGGTPAAARLDRAAINVSGAITTFDYAPVKLAAAASEPTAIVLGDTLYLIDGSASQYAPINPDGTLGSFTADPSINIGGYYAVVGNWLYSLSRSGHMRAPIAADGTLGSFAAVTLAKTSLGQYQLCVSGNTLYSLGGFSDAGTFASTAIVEASTIAADGTLGDFSTTNVPQLSDQRLRGASAFLGSRMAVFSGYNTPSAGQTPAPNVISVDATTLLLTGSWVNTSNVFTNFDPGAAVVGPTLYQLGGAYIDVLVKAAAVSDATVTFSTVNGVTMKVAARQFPATLVTDSHVYVLGGLAPPAPAAPAVAVDTMEQASLK
jgi:N-acetylneuraminic acid mutarotase